MRVADPAVMAAASRRVIGHCVSADDWAAWASVYLPPIDRPAKRELHSASSVLAGFCGDCRLGYFLEMQAAGRCLRPPTYGKVLRRQEQAIRAAAPGPSEKSRPAAPAWLRRAAVA